MVPLRSPSRLGRARCSSASTRCRCPPTRTRHASARLVTHPRSPPNARWVQKHGARICTRGGRESPRARGVFRSYIFAGLLSRGPPTPVSINDRDRARFVVQESVSGDPLPEPTRLEKGIVDRVMQDLTSKHFVAALAKEARRISAPTPDTEVASPRAEVKNLTATITRFTDLAGQCETPRPFLERIAEAEKRRTQALEVIEERMSEAGCRRSPTFDHRARHRKIACWAGESFGRGRPGRAQRHAFRGDRADRARPARTYLPDPLPDTDRGFDGVPTARPRNPRSSDRESIQASVTTTYVASKPGIG